MNSDDVRQRERRFILVIGLVFGLPFAGALGLQALSRRHAAAVSGTSGSPAGAPGAPRSGGGAPSLLLVRGSDERSGSSTTAPAVDTQQIDRRLLAASATVGGDLEVSLAWNSLSDLDLQVRDPAGELITAHRPRSASGGVQDVDANPTLVSPEGERRVESGRPPGAENLLEVPEFLVDLEEKFGLKDVPGITTLPGREGKAPSRFTRKAVEHIYFSRAPAGQYTVNVQCYSWRESSAVPLPCTVQVRSRGKVFFQRSGTLGPRSYAVDGMIPTQVCQFVVR